MSESWWKKTGKAIKGSTRLKHRGLENEEQLCIMFEDLRNTSDEYWSASSGIAPSPATRETSPIPVVVVVDDDDDDDDDDEGANDDFSYS
ncbi:unnamed protein product [Urochloa humidicola]